MVDIVSNLSNYAQKKETKILKTHYLFTIKITYVLRTRDYAIKIIYERNEGNKYFKYNL